MPSLRLPVWPLRTPRAGPGQLHPFWVQGLGTPEDGYVSGQSTPVQPAPLPTGCSRGADRVSSLLSIHWVVTGASRAPCIPHKAAIAISWLSAGAALSESGPPAPGPPQDEKLAVLRTWWFFTDRPTCLGKVTRAPGESGPGTPQPCQEVLWPQPTC